MSVLLIAEHNNKELKPFTLNASTAASKIDTDVHGVIIGHNCDEAAKALSELPLIKKVIQVDAAIRVMEGEVDLDKRNAAIAKAWKIVKDDISYLPLHHQVISWASKSNVNVPIRPNNEPLFRTASFN